MSQLIEPNVLTPPPSPVEGITACILIVATPCDPNGPLAGYATVTIETADLKLTRAVEAELEAIFPEKNCVCHDTTRSPHRFGLLNLQSRAAIQALQTLIERAIGRSERVAIVHVGELRVFKVSGRFNDHTLGGPFRVITLIVVTAYEDKIRPLAAAYWLKLINEERSGRHLAPIAEATPLILSGSQDKHGRRYDEWGYWVREVSLREGTVSRIPYTKPPSFVAAELK
jgi:hypothetical protein